MPRLTLRQAAADLLDLYDRFGLLKPGPGELLDEAKDAIEAIREAVTRR